jgi:hypothetical protein
MDQFFFQLLLLDEAQIKGVMLLLIVTGGLLGALIFTVRIKFRRIAYLWFVAGIGLAFTIAQLGWFLVPAAAKSGLVSTLVIALLSSVVLFGAALYFGSAARSNDIKGTTGSAWLGFVPFANLWLMCARGTGTSRVDEEERSGIAKFVVDPILVIGGLFVLGLTGIIDKALEQAPAPSASESAALSSSVAETQTLEARFASEAAASSKNLPHRIDEITVLTSIEADGHTLRMVYDVEQAVDRFLPGFKRRIADEMCGAEMFAGELQLGGRLVYLYRGPKGEIIDEFEIKQSDC